MDNIDLEKLTLPVAPKHATTDRKTLPRHKTGGKFLKGPIPWDWVAKAAFVPGKAMQVAVALWFLAGMKKKPTVILSSAVLSDLGVKRNAAYRALAGLEEAGLVSVIRHQGRSSIVTLMELKE